MYVQKIYNCISFLIFQKCLVAVSYIHPDLCWSVVMEEKPCVKKLSPAFCHFSPWKCLLQKLNGWKEKLSCTSYTELLENPCVLPFSGLAPRQKVSLTYIKMSNFHKQVNSHWRTLLLFNIKMILNYHVTSHGNMYHINHHWESPDKHAGFYAQH